MGDCCVFSDDFINIYLLRAGESVKISRNATATWHDSSFMPHPSLFYTPALAFVPLASGINTATITAQVVDWIETSTHTSEDELSNNDV